MPFEYRPHEVEAIRLKNYYTMLDRTDFAFLHDTQHQEKNPGKELPPVGVVHLGDGGYKKIKTED